MPTPTLPDKFVPRIITAARDNFEVLLRGTRAAKVMSATAKELPCPQIDLALHEFYRPTGRLIASGNGPLAEVEFSVVAGGRARRICGAAVSLPNGLDVRFPFGFLQAQAA